MTMGEEASCERNEACVNHALALHLKLVSMAAIFVASMMGVCMPVIGKTCGAVRNEGRVLFVMKAFAAGVVLATGYVHMMPDAFYSLTNPCLPETPWRTFPFAGLIAMASTLGTLLLDFFGTLFYARKRKNGHFSEAPKSLNTQSLPLEAQNQGLPDESSATNASQERYRVISQVLEVGVVAHSLIIGVSLGSSQKPCIVRPLMAALSFHQFFEGIALGGCIAQASFKNQVVVVMILFFSMTTPIGIAVGMAISSVYNERSSRALIVEGLMDSVSAGILVYMALVDLIAADFMNDRLLRDSKLQVFAFSALMLGAGLTSLIAMWA